MIKIKTITENLVFYLSHITGFSGKVFPMLAKEGTSLPFITYNRVSISPGNTKDGSTTSVSYQINIISKEYLQGVEILDEVIRVLIRMGVFNGIRHTVTVTGASEEAYDDGYVQVLNLDIEATYA